MIFYVIINASINKFVKTHFMLFCIVLQFLFLAFWKIHKERVICSFWIITISFFFKLHTVLVGTVFAHLLSTAPKYICIATFRAYLFRAESSNFIFEHFLIMLFAPFKLPFISAIFAIACVCSSWFECVSAHLANKLSFFWNTSLIYFIHLHLTLLYIWQCYYCDILIIFQFFNAVNKKFRFFVKLMLDNNIIVIYNKVTVKQK